MPVIAGSVWEAREAAFDDASSSAPPMIEGDDTSAGTSSLWLICVAPFEYLRQDALAHTGSRRLIMQDGQDNKSAVFGQRVRALSASEIAQVTGSANAAAASKKADFGKDYFAKDE